MLPRARIALSSLAVLLAAASPSLAQTMVISQVYGAGNNTGANWQNDYIEVFNPNQVAVDITGWSVQYAASTGTTWQVTALSGTVPAGGYYLVREGGGVTNGAPLPGFDATGSILMSATTGKVALVRNSTALSGACPTTNIADFLGYGSTANCSEGTRFTGTFNATQALFRKNNGCQDTQSNIDDFEVLTALPRYSATPPNVCPPLPGADVSSAMTVSPRISLPIGGTITYVITVTNNGPDDAENVMVIDDVPGELTVTNVTASQGSAMNSGNSVSASLGTIANAGMATVTITATSNSEAVIQNSATVSTTTNDPNGGNNNSSATHYVLARGELIVGVNNVANPVFAVNPDTGTAAPLFSNISVNGLAADEANRILYLASGSNLHTVPYDTLVVSAATPITYNGAAQVVVGLAFANGRLFASDIAHSVAASPEGIYEVNTTTGETTLLLNLTDANTARDFAGIDFDPHRDLFYGNDDDADGGTGLNSIDLFASGNITFISEYPTFGGDGAGTKDIDGLAVGNDRAYLVPDETGQIGRYNLANNNADSAIANPWNAQRAESGGAWAPSLLAPRTGANLFISHADSAQSVSQGGEAFSYVITVKNTGPNDATNVVVTDTLPSPGVSFVSVDASQGSGSHNNGVVTANLGALANGATATVTVNVVTTNVAGVLIATATVSATEPDPVADNNLAACRTFVLTNANLIVSQTDSPDPVPTLGDNVIYTVTVNNNGPEAASNVVLTDILPANSTFVSATGDGSPTHDNGVVTANIGTLANGASAAIMIEVTPAFVGQINNRASVTLTENDPSPADNTSVEQTTVVRIAAPLIVGTTTTSQDVFAIDVNSGIANSLFGGQAVMGMTADQANRVLYLCTTTTLFRVPFDALFPEQIATFSGGFTSMTSGGLAWDSTRGKLYGSVTDRIFEINIATGITTLVWDIGVGDFAGLDYDPVSDMLYATNDSVTTQVNPPVDGRGLYRIDPINMTIQKLTGYPIKFGTTLETDIDGLAIGNGRAYMCADEGQWAYVFNLSNSSFESPIEQPYGPDRGNGGAAWAPELFIAPAGANLRVTMTDTPDPVTPVGTNLTYTIVVRNLGIADAVNVVVTDMLAPTLLFQSVASSQGSGDHSNGLVTVNLGDIPVGGEASIDIVVQTTVAETVLNTATAISDTADPHPGNNSATTSTVVRDPLADISLTATLNSGCAQPVGSQVNYSFNVTNNGPEEATNVVVTSNVPAGTMFISASFPAVEENGVITANIGNLGNGANFSFDVTVETTMTGTITASGTATATEMDPNGSNNMASVPFLVSPNVATAVGIVSTIPGSPTSEVPGFGGVRFQSTAGFTRPFRSPNGTRWIMPADTDIATATMDEVLLVGSGTSFSVVAQEGVTMLAEGDRVGVFDGVTSINDSGQYAFSTNTDDANTSIDEVVVKWDGASLLTVAREGAAVPAFGGSITYGASSSSVVIASDGAVSYFATLGGTGGTTMDSAVLRSDGAVVVAQKGVDIPTGQDGGATFTYKFFESGTTEGQGFFMNGAGTRYSLGAMVNDSSTNRDEVIVVDGAVVAQENVILPGSGFSSPVQPTSPFNMNWMESNGDYYAYGDNADNQDWVTRNGIVIAKTDDPITPGNPELWDDAPYAQTFYFAFGDSNGNYVVGGTTNAADENANAVLVLNGTTVISRENDPVDLDGNGVFDDDTFIRTYRDDRGFLSDDGYLYIVARLRNAVGYCAGGNADIGQALIRIPVSTPPGCPYARGDMTGSGVIDGDDSQLWVDCAFTPGAPTGICICADMDNNGVINETDVQLYVAALLGL